jgi:hypothetical protein
VVRDEAAGRLSTGADTDREGVEDASMAAEDAAMHDDAIAASRSSAPAPTPGGAPTAAKDEDEDEEAAPTPS